MEYETRHMEALKPMYYQGEALEVGQCFYATPIDAGYFVRHARAREIPMSASLSGLSVPADGYGTPVAYVAPDEKESPAAASEPVEVASVQTESPAEGAGPAADEDDFETHNVQQLQDPDPVLIRVPRRGRPPRAAAVEAPNPDPQD